MEVNVTIDEQTFAQLQQTGEIQVIASHGAPVVLMTVDARRQLHKVEYDDGDVSAEEMLTLVAPALKDPDDWGHPDMDVYDATYGDHFKSDGEVK